MTGKDTERQTRESAKSYRTLDMSAAWKAKMSVARANGAELEQQMSRREGTTVPQTGETILWYLCSPDRLEVVLGDLERNFKRRAASHGEQAARRWYWWQISRTVVVFGFQVIVKVAVQRGVLEKLGIGAG
jgi:hypothetical protein